MKPYFLTAFLFFFLLSDSIAQYNPKKVDSLKRELQVTSGIKKADCLNELVTIYLAQETLQARLDSTYPYAIKANEEAQNSKYFPGQAKSLLNLATIEQVKLNIEKRKRNPVIQPLVSNFERLDVRHHGLIVTGVPTETASYNSFMCSFSNATQPHVQSLFAP